MLSFVTSASGLQDTYSQSASSSRCERQNPSGFFDGTPAALKSNLETRAEATSFLKAGGAIIIFPAGAISLSKKIVNSAFDVPWKTFAAKLALHPDTVTLPFFFEGKNSILFQIARKFSLTLGYALMFHETCRLMGTSIAVQIRAPLDS